MNNKATIRIVLDLALVISVLQGWWFVTLPLGLMGAWGFSYFLEFVLAGFAYDLSFGLAGIGLIGYSGAIVSVILFTIIAAAKRLLRK